MYENITECLEFSSCDLFGITASHPMWDGKMFYSTDRIAWIEWTGATITALKCKDGYHLYLAGKGNTQITTEEISVKGVSGFSISGTNVACTGNIMALLDCDNPNKANMKPGCFYKLFKGCTVLTSAPKLPAQNLSDKCYKMMFAGCVSLIRAPELPAKNLSDDCYRDMFSFCTSLIFGPKVLPAEILANNCYTGMFHGCTSLTCAPKISAKTLSFSCCANMFYGCTALRSAPELSVEKLEQYCYSGMFFDCTSLTTAPELPAKTMDYSCYRNMFCGCTSLTSAPKLPALALKEACYFGMFYNCTSLRHVPELPAKVMAHSCYANMFCGCTGLKSIPKQPDDLTLAPSCFDNMFADCMTNIISEDDCDDVEATNFEIYKEELCESYGTSFAVVDNHLCTCSPEKCDVCLFKKDKQAKDCSRARMRWLFRGAGSGYIDIPDGTPIDSKILVSTDGKNWFGQYYAGFHNGKHMVFVDGVSSWSGGKSHSDPKFASYYYMKLVREEHRKMYHANCCKCAHYRISHDEYPCKVCDTSDSHFESATAPKGCYNCTHYYDKSGDTKSPCEKCVMGEKWEK